MQRHLNGHGVSVSRSESQSLIEHQMTLLQSVMQDISSVSEYMTGEKVKGYSCHCLVGSLKLQNVYRHLSSGRTCGAPSPTEEELQISTCGRMISLKALQIKYSCQEAPSLKTSTQLQATLHVLPDMMGCFVPLFHPLAQDEPYPSRPKGRSFKERVHFLYDSINLKHIIDNQPLFDLLYHQGENWLTAQAALHVQMVPANYRSRLLVFDGARSPNAISTFTFTAYPKRLLPEFKKLLSFLCQSNHKLLPLTRDIPSLLAKLCLETVDSVQHHTTVMTYCAGRVVRGQEGSETLSVWSPSYIATMLSAILAMLRASICSMIYFMGRGYHEKASRLVENVQNSITVNFLASTIRRMRWRESLTPSSRKVSIQDNYDILVDGFMFKFQKWSNVIPIIFDKLVASLCKVIKGNRWVNLLNRRYPLFVCWSSMGKTTMTLASGHNNYSQEDIVLQDDYDLCDIDVLASYLELAFHGTGLGSMRYTEISRSLFSDVRWHGGCVYYYSHSEKAFSVHHKGKNLIEHKLCMTLSRAYMVFRVLCELRHESLGCLVPVRNNWAFNVLYLPLFPLNKLDCHPPLPNHSYSPIEHSTGSQNIELYQTDVSMDIDDAERESIEVLYPAFVFHPSDLEKPDNSWAEGIKNVYVVRFSVFKNEDGKQKMTLANPREIKCFPTDYQRKEDFPKDICLFWVSLVLDTVGFERVHMSTRGYSICAYEH